MPKKIVRGKIFYTTKEEVEKIKKKGDRIYYVRGTGYYISRPKKEIFILPEKKVQFWKNLAINITIAVFFFILGIYFSC